MLNVCWIFKSWLPFQVSQFITIWHPQGLPPKEVFLAFPMKPCEHILDTLRGATLRSCKSPCHIVGKLCGAAFSNQRGPRKNVAFFVGEQRSESKSHRNLLVYEERKEIHEPWCIFQSDVSPATMWSAKQRSWLGKVKLFTQAIPYQPQSPCLLFVTWTSE